jgi:hypothetical protein
VASGEGVFWESVLTREGFLGEDVALDVHGRRGAHADVAHVRWGARELGEPVEVHHPEPKDAPGDHAEGRVLSRVVHLPDLHHGADDGLGVLDGHVEHLRDEREGAEETFERRGCRHGAVDDPTGQRVVAGYHEREGVPREETLIWHR